MYYKLVLVVIVRTLTDISFKKAVQKLSISSFSSIIPAIRQIMFNPFLWIGILLGITNVVTWCFSLKDFDLSYAYPFLSISYITIIISGKFLFHEHLDKYKISGLIFISIGALMLFL